MEPEVLGKVEWVYASVLNLHPQERAAICNHLWEKVERIGLNTEGLEHWTVAQQILIMSALLQIFYEGQGHYSYSH